MQNVVFEEKIENDKNHICTEKNIYLTVI